MGLSAVEGGKDERAALFTGRELRIGDQRAMRAKT